MHFPEILEAGLRVCHTLIFGGPGETESTIRNTCRAMQLMRPTAVVAMTGVRVYPGTPLATQLITSGEADSDIGLTPAFYIEPAVKDFLPAFLQQQARSGGLFLLIDPTGTHNKAKPFQIQRKTLTIYLLES